VREGKDQQMKDKKKKHKPKENHVLMLKEPEGVIPVSDMGLFGEVPMVDFVTC
jgi:hypothetical protein